MKREKEISRLIDSQNFELNSQINLIPGQNANLLPTAGHTENFPRFYGESGFSFGKMATLAEKVTAEEFGANHAVVGFNDLNHAMFSAIRMFANNIENSTKCKVAISFGNMFNCRQFWFNEGYDLGFYHHLTEAWMDYDEIAKEIDKLEPDIIIVGDLHYPRQIDWNIFRELADRHNAKLICNMGYAGLLYATGVNHSPVPWADVCVGSFAGTLNTSLKAFALHSNEQDYARHHLNCDSVMTFGDYTNIAFNMDGISEEEDLAWNIRKNARAFADYLYQLGVPIHTQSSHMHNVTLGLDIGIPDDVLVNMLRNSNIMVDSGMSFDVTYETIKRGFDLPFFDALAKKIVDTIENAK